MTAVCEVAGHPTLSGRMFEPAVGIWHAALELDAEEVPTGPVTLVFDGGQRMTGTVTSARSVADQGRVKLRVDGGSGQLDQALEPRHFRNTNVRSLIRDLTQTTGDTIDDASTVLDTFVRYWTRPKTLAHAYLQSIADETDARWRVQRSGQLWMGAETWTAAEGRYEEQTKLQGGVAIIPDDGPFVLPGTTFQGQRVAEVITTWGAEGSALGDQPLTQAIAFEDNQETASRHTRSVQHDVADWFERTDGVRTRLSAMYPCRVVGQSEDLLKVDLLPDDPEVRANGLNRVPIRYGMPGLRCTLKTGARVMLGYDAGDPKRPFAAICDRDGISKVHIEPDSSGDVDIKTSGSGVLRIESDAVVQVIAPDVRLGSEGGTSVACKGDLCVGTVEPLYYQHASGTMMPVVPAAALAKVPAALTSALAGNLSAIQGLASGATVTSTITRGRPGVKAG